MCYSKNFVFTVKLYKISSQHCFQNVVCMPAPMNNSVKLIAHRLLLTLYDNDNDNDNDNTFIEHKYRLQIRIYI